jgi:hypothetical protein
MSRCACVFTDIDEFYETIEQKIVTARKSHKCEECKREIIPGEKYEYYKGVFDNKIYCEKTCQDCLSLRNSGIFCNGFCFERVWDDFFDAVQDSGGGVDWEALSKLTPKAKEKAFDIIEHIWGDIDDCD